MSDLTCRWMSLVSSEINELRMSWFECVTVCSVWAVAFECLFALDSPCLLCILMSNRGKNCVPTVYQIPTHESSLRHRRCTYNMKRYFLHMLIACCVRILWTTLEIVKNFLFSFLTPHKYSNRIQATEHYLIKIKKLISLRLNNYICKIYKNETGSAFWPVFVSCELVCLLILVFTNL